MAEDDPVVKRVAVPGRNRVEDRMIWMLDAKKLLCLLRRELEQRLENSPAQRRMLDDYLEGRRPGSPGSRFEGATAASLEQNRSRLATAFGAAVKDVAERFGNDPAICEMLHQLAETVLNRAVPRVRNPIQAIVRCLSFRVAEQPATRALLDDYRRGVQPGGHDSALAGTPEAVLHQIRTRLARELQGAIRDVAEADSANAPNLVRLARLVALSLQQEKGSLTLDELMRAWINISRSNGVSDQDFIYGG
jgi:hypothetical protein